MTKPHPFLQRLATHGMYEPPDKAIRVQDGGVTTVISPSRYAQAALDAECTNVANAPEGTRNDTLNRACYSLGGLVASGHLEPEATAHALTKAARACGLPEHEILSVVGRAMADGGRNPREITPRSNGESIKPAYVLTDANATTTATAEPTKPQRVPLKDRLLSPSQLKDIGSVEPLIDGILYRDTLAQLSGAPGSYKSFLTVGIGCALSSTLSNWEGHRVPKRGKVVYVAAEGATGLRGRILAWCELTAVDPAELEGWLYILPCPIQLGDVVDISEAIDLVREIDADLLILDTRARCTVGLEENSATEQGRAIAATEAIQSAAGCAILSVHHSSRTGSAGRGSNSWDGAVWSDLRLEGAELHAKLHIEKHKDVPAGMDYHFRLVEHVVSSDNMPEVSEYQRHTLVLVGDASMSENGVRTNTLAVEKNADRLMEILRTKLTADGLSAATIRGLAEDDGMKKSSFYEALKLLVDRGLLRNSGSEKRAHYMRTAAPWSASKE